jgi:hypothetical protein
MLCLAVNLHAIYILRGRLGHRDGQAGRRAELNLRIAGSLRSILVQEQDHLIALATALGIDPLDPEICRLMKRRKHGGISDKHVGGTSINSYRAFSQLASSVKLLSVLE